MIGAGWKLAAEAGSWALAVAWCVHTRTVLRRLGGIPDLSEVQWDLCPTAAPGLIVAVPARDEAEALPAAMATLLAQDYPWLRVVAIDDRSTDATGSLLEDLAAQHPRKLDALHLTETAEGWMGKTFAMQVALDRSRSEYILFTDADVWFSPSVLRRALAYAQMTDADHLVVLPTAVTKTWGERTIISFLQVLALWVSRPWRVADPQARWDVAAAGSFNLLRRDALEELGGFEPQRLAVVEDITLGRRVRAAGMRQRLVFAPGLVLVHWAPGAWGLIRGMTKNLFALVNFRAPLQGLAMLVVAVLFLLPLAGMAWRPSLLPSLLTLGCIAVCYQAVSVLSGISARFGWLYPLGAVAMLWAMLRSVLLTWWRRGVLWRGTLYPLGELRSGNSPFIWEWQAAKLRGEQRAARRAVHPSPWLRAVNRLRRRPARTPPPSPGRSGARRTRPE